MSEPIIWKAITTVKRSSSYDSIFNCVRAIGHAGFKSASLRPSFLALKAPYFRCGSFKRLAKYALKPVFKSSGLEWRPPPISVSLHFCLFVVGTVVGISFFAVI